MPVFAVQQRPKRQSQCSGLSTMTLLVEAVDKKEALVKALAYRPEHKLFETEKSPYFGRITVNEVGLPYIITS